MLGKSSSTVPSSCNVPSLGIMCAIHPFFVQWAISYHKRENCQREMDNNGRKWTLVDENGQRTTIIGILKVLIIKFVACVALILQKS
jgi:hypothetical protein